MINLFRVSVLLFILQFVPLNLFCQSVFEIHAGPSISLSNSGPFLIQTTLEDYFASPGLGLILGTDYSYQFSKNGLGGFISFDFILNGIHKNYKEIVERMSNDFGMTLIKHAKYMNIPFTIGPFYKYSLFDALSITVKPGIAVNFMSMTDYEWDTGITEIDWTSNIGYRIGVGATFKKNYSLSVNYLGLGVLELKGRNISSNLPPREFTENVHLQLLTVAAGYIF